MQVLAIIPARGGSKGIKDKNLQRVGGVSLVGRSIRAALGSKYHCRVVVSTDSGAIADEARRCGAEAIMRPPELSGDSASSESALLHVLDHLRATEAYQPDILLFLQCTSPFTFAEDIDGTLDHMIAAKADTALSVTHFHYFLWEPASAADAVGEGHSAVSVGHADGFADWQGINHHKSRRQLRQERKPQYLETGSIYAMDAAGFLQHKHRFFGKTVAHVLPNERCMEIDDPCDLDLARARVHQIEGGAHTLPFVPQAMVFDFDGVFTDNGVLVDETGRESVRCNRSDGLGLGMLKAAGIPLLILSKERNPVVSKRAEKLGIECVQAMDNKRDFLKGWAAERGYDPARISYLGNDINDIESMQWVGLPVAVADAYPPVKAEAAVVLQRAGGHGAVRELADLVLQRLHG